MMRLRVGEHPLTHLLPPLALRREHELIRKRRLFLDANGGGLGSFTPRRDETLRLRLEHGAAAQHDASMQLHLLGSRAAGLLSPPVREPRLRCGACRHVGRLGVGPLVILLCHQCVVVLRLPLGERNVLPHQRVAPKLYGGVLGEQLGALPLPRGFKRAGRDAVEGGEGLVALAQQGDLGLGTRLEMSEAHTVHGLLVRALQLDGVRNRGLLDVLEVQHEQLGAHVGASGRRLGAQSRCELDHLGHVAPHRGHVLADRG